MHKSQVFMLTSITLSCFAAWLYIVTQLQPTRTDTFVLATFFVTLLVWLGSLLALLFYKLKVKQSNRQVIYAYIKPSIRQGFLVAATLCTLLFLQMLNVIGIWEILLVIIVAIFFEMAWRQGHSARKV